MTIRKAETLKHLTELNLSTRTKTYLASKFNSLDEVIFEGRLMAHNRANYPEKFKRKAMIELVNALDMAGFIRHDIDTASFAISQIYRMVSCDTIDVTIPVNFERPSRVAKRIGDDGMHSCTDYRARNEKYENFRNPTSDQINTVRESLKTRLTDAEYALIAYELGLENGKTHNIAQISEYLNIPNGHVRRIRAAILRKIEDNTIVPPSDEQEVSSIIEEIEKLRKNPIFEKEAKLINELHKIRKDPIFKREASLKERLREISKMPIGCAEAAAKYLDDGSFDSSDIENLGLRVCTYNCLKRAGINTIADVIKLPKEDWLKIKNLGRTSLNEIEEKIHKVGYADFKIILP